MIAHVSLSAPWLIERLTEARSVVADVAGRNDHLIRLACNVLVAYGENPAERSNARALLKVLDVQRPLRRAQREKHGTVAQ